MPDNSIKVKLRFNKPVLADVVGDTAKHLLRAADYNNNQQLHPPFTSATNPIPSLPVPMSITLPSSSILVSENFVSTIVGAPELPTYTSCRLGKITQVIVVLTSWHTILFELMTWWYNDILLFYLTRGHTIILPFCSFVVVFSFLSVLLTIYITYTFHCPLTTTHIPSLTNVIRLNAH